MKHSTPPPPTWAALRRPGRPSAWPIFLVALFLLLRAESVQAQPFNGLRYTVNADSTVSITGFDRGPRVVVIPDRIEGRPVTAVGSGAFSECRLLTQVTIPRVVTSIGVIGFNGCTRLTSLIIPDGVTSIQDFSFQYCRRLQSVAIPGSVTNIGWYAFKSCESLTNITVPGSVTDIGEKAFGERFWLRSATIGKGDTHPDHDTICTFRRENRALLSECFVKVLQMAQELKVALEWELVCLANNFRRLHTLGMGTKLAATRWQRGIDPKRTAEVLELVIRSGRSRPAGWFRR